MQYYLQYNMAPNYGDRMLDAVFLVCVVTVFLVGRTLCVHQYDRDVLLHIRDTTSECNMQPNYRFNDIVLPGQNWVTDQPARGQRVRKRGRRGNAIEIYDPHYRLCFCRMFALYATRPMSFCKIYI